MKLSVMTTLAACLAGALFSQQALAENHTVSVGYAQAKVQDFKNIRGVNVQYRYEWDSPLSVLGSFTYMKGDEDYNTLVDRDIIRGNIDAKYYSVMAGPAWRLNEFVSVYGQLGVAHSKADANYRWLNHNGDGTHTDMGNHSESFSSTSVAWGAGVLFNPVDYLSVSLGYEGTRADLDGNRSINGFNLAVGYRF